METDHLNDMATAGGWEDSEVIERKKKLEVPRSLNPLPLPQRRDEADQFMIGRPSFDTPKRLLPGRLFHRFFRLSDRLATFQNEEKPQKGWPTPRLWCLGEQRGDAPSTAHRPPAGMAPCTVPHHVW